MIRGLRTVLLLLSILAGSVCMAVDDKGIPDTGNPEIVLWPDGAPDALGHGPGDTPTVTLFTPPEGTATGAAIIVCPGGGYSKLAMGHEGMEVVEWLTQNGITAFLLKYRHGPRYLHPAPLQDIQRAIRLVRSCADEWDVDPKRIGVLGFSAGGHLAATSAIYYKRGNPLAKNAINRVNSKPNFLILCYPVISLIRPKSHRGSLHNLLGPKPKKEDREKLSLDLHVTKKTPPTFLVHTSVDRSVSAENSALFYIALLKHGVPAELHIFEEGKHGLGLGPSEISFSEWPGLCLKWLNARGILEPEPGKG